MIKKIAIIVIILVSTMFVINSCHSQFKRLPLPQVTPVPCMCPNIPSMHHCNKSLKKVIPSPTPLVIEITAIKTTTIEKQVEVLVHKQNRLRLLAGIGPTGTDLTTSPTTATFNYNYGLVVGAGYDRQITDNWSVGASVFTNNTWMVGVGFDF
jgi:hypothetical protein